MSGPPHRLPGLDGLRAISIVLVILGHCVGTANFILPKFIGGFAEVGVRVFFVISGFLITTLLLKELARTDTISLKGFYIRRTFRIFPAFYTYIAVVAVLQAFGIFELLPGDLGCAVTYTMNYHRPRSWYVGHLWSLSVEEQFYLLWPAVMLLFRRHAGLVSLLAIAAAPFLRVAIWVLWPAHRLGIGETFPTIFDALAVGCLLAILRPKLHANKTYMMLTSTPAALIATAVVIAAHSVPRVSFDLFVGQTIQNVAIALIIDWAVQERSPSSSKVLEFGPLAWVGRLSYSLYLWQQLFVNRNSQHWIHAFPLNVGIAVIVAMVSYYGVEQPFLRLRERPQRPRKPAAAK